MNSEFNFLEFTQNQEKQFEKFVLPQLNSGNRVNIAFSTNFCDLNYYYLSQLFFIAKFSKYTNAYFYIFLSDTVLSAKKHVHFSTPMARREEKGISVLTSELRQVLNSFGVPDERLHIFLISDAWRRFLSLDRNNVIDFFKAVSLFPNDALKVPNKEIKHYFLPSNSHFSLAYAVQKFTDLFVYSSLGKIYPDEIKGNIDFVFIGASGSKLALAAREIMIQEGLISEEYPVFGIFNSIPCFGHTLQNGKSFCIPNGNMRAFEILNIIRKYNLSSDNIEELFDSFLNKAMDKFVIEEKEGVLKTANVSPDLSNISLKNQQKLLAYNLELFLKGVMDKLAKSLLSGHYSISKREEIIKFNRLLKNKDTFLILDMCTGEYTITEIANKLKRHTSNVSRSISQLKDCGFVRINKDGTIEKCITTLKINI